jgi:hypothetical protein
MAYLTALFVSLLFLPLSNATCISDCHSAFEKLHIMPTGQGRFNFAPYWGRDQISTSIVVMLRWLVDNWWWHNKRLGESFQFVGRLLLWLECMSLLKAPVAPWKCQFLNNSRINWEKIKKGGTLLTWKITCHDEFSEKSQSLHEFRDQFLSQSSKVCWPRAFLINAIYKIKPHK